MVRLEEAVESSRRAGRPPKALAELDEVRSGSHFRRVEDGRVLDPWGSPYQYRAEGDSYSLYSLGPDGQPGGEGLDADVYPTSAGRPLEPPTLPQFTLRLPTQGVRLACILAGACAAIVCLLPSRNRRGVGFFARAGATAIGATVVAVFVSYLHIPTGH